MITKEQGKRLIDYLKLRKEVDAVVCEVALKCFFAFDPPDRRFGDLIYYHQRDGVRSVEIEAWEVDHSSRNLIVCDWIETSRDIRAGELKFPINILYDEEKLNAYLAKLEAKKQQRVSRVEEKRRKNAIKVRKDLREQLAELEKTYPGISE